MFNWAARAPEYVRSRVAAEDLRRPAELLARVRRLLPVDLPHVRPTAWLDRRFAEDEVPAAVAATFGRGGRNFQRTHDREAERGSATLWAAGDG